jgi:hypothetical protein
MFSFRKKEPVNEAEVKLKKISELLFPPLQLREEVDKDGRLYKFHIDHSIDSNLDAVLMDLQDGHNDQAVHKTLNMSINRLNDVRRLLEAYAAFDQEATYIIVEDPEDEKEIEVSD